MKVSIKWRFLASGCRQQLATRGEGGGQWGDGGQSAVGGEQWSCLQPLRTALHTISISLKTFSAETELTGYKST